MLLGISRNSVRQSAVHTSNLLFTAIGNRAFVCRSDSGIVTSTHVPQRIRQSPENCSGNSMLRLTAQFADLLANQTDVASDACDIGKKSLAKR